MERFAGAGPCERKKCRIPAGESPAGVNFVWRRSCRSGASMKPRRPMGPKESERLHSAYEDRVRELQFAVDRQDRQLQILSRVASRIQGEDEIGRILAIGIDEILEGMGLKAGWIFLGDDSNKKLHLGAARGVSASYLDQIQREGLEDCLCPEVFWSGHTMQARNTNQCPRMPTIVEGLAEPVAHACIPLNFEDERRGVLNVAARPGEQFADDELHFFETLGHQLCLAVERARHVGAERKHNREARALAALNKSIGGSLAVDAVLEAVGATARDVLGAERIHILLGADPGALRLAHLAGLPDPELSQGQMVDLGALGIPEAVTALETREPLVVHDAEVDDRTAREVWRRWDIRAGMLLPLSNRDKTLGIMALGRTRAHQWSPEQVDVAEALAAQASVALDNARLYEESRAAYSGLKDAQARIIQTEKLAVVGTLASGLAHEVRNPLNSMALQLSVLERRIAALDGGVSGQMRELTGVIREEILRLDSLVGDFLLFSRTNRVQFRATSLDALLDDVVRLLRPEARGANVTLRRQRIGNELPDVRVDGEKMKQVMINLIRNGIEAIADGGVVTVESGLVAGQARIVVRDTGPGLPEGIDVFQLFVTTKPRGTGLGLSIVQQIVLEHGGEVIAADFPGEGAMFTVTLPLAPAEGGVHDQAEEP
jgi:signal transduction histidine kinase